MRCAEAAGRRGKGRRYAKLSAWWTDGRTDDGLERRAVGEWYLWSIFRARFAFPPKKSQMATAQNAAEGEVGKVSSRAEAAAGVGEAAFLFLQRRGA